jgi:hypothetical protein
VKRVAFRTGYNISFDTWHGLEIYIFGFYCAFGFNWPKVTWFNPDWAIDECGTLRSLPVRRKKRKRWLFRTLSWRVRACCAVR